LAPHAGQIQISAELIGLSRTLLTGRGRSERAQREQFAALAERLSSAADAAEGFERGLLLSRLHSTAAAVQFTEAMLSEPTLTEP